jgi:hypothetical protein
MYTLRKAKHIHKRETHLLRTIIAKVQLGKKSLVVSLKGLDAKTN